MNFILTLICMVQSSVHELISSQVKLLDGAVRDSVAHGAREEASKGLGGSNGMTG